MNKDHDTTKEAVPLEREGTQPTNVGRQAAEDVVGSLIARARCEPIGVDVSDWSDEWVQGFLAGQASILEEIAREPERYGVTLIDGDIGVDPQTGAST